MPKCFAFFLDVWQIDILFLLEKPCTERLSRHCFVSVRLPKVEQKRGEHL